ncbi:MAG: hypothetical protein AVDCRST_MAG93-1575, partial [uncultured Chloroflexia bacterium]
FFKAHVDTQFALAVAATQGDGLLMPSMTPPWLLK